MNIKIKNITESKKLVFTDNVIALLNNDDVVMVATRKKYDNLPETERHFLNFLCALTGVSCNIYFFIDYAKSNNLEVTINED